MSEHVEEGEQSVYEQDARAVHAINKILNGRALRPSAPYQPKTISARVSENAHIGLKAIAQQLGYTWNNQGNLSMLLEAIGTGTVQVTPTELQARHL